MSRYLVLIFIALLVEFLPTVVMGAESQIVECQSENVWDEGFVFRFDLSSCKSSPQVQLDARLFQIVTMWNPELVFVGTLAKTPLEDSHFSLQAAEDSTVEIEFDLRSESPHIEVLRLNGIKPAKFARLQCNPEFLRRLQENCI